MAVLSVSKLVEAGVCAPVIEDFQALFGESVEVTEDLAEKHSKKFDFLSKAALRLLNGGETPAGLEERIIEEAEEAAQAAYDAEMAAWSAAITNACNALHRAWVADEDADYIYCRACEAADRIADPEARKAAYRDAARAKAEAWYALDRAQWRRERLWSRAGRRRAQARARRRAKAAYAIAIARAWARLYNQQQSAAELAAAK